MKTTSKSNIPINIQSDALWFEFAENSTKLGPDIAGVIYPDERIGLAF
jgi:hypothetical protein